MSAVAVLLLAIGATIGAIMLTVALILVLAPNGDAGEHQEPQG